MENAAALAKLEKSLCDALTEVQQADLLAQTATVDNNELQSCMCVHRFFFMLDTAPPYPVRALTCARAYSGRRARFSEHLERLRTIRCPPGLGVPYELLERFIDEDRSPDDFGAELGKRLRASQEAHRGKASALQNLWEGLHKAATEEPSLLTEKPTPSSTG
eukprot:6202692-Pleurochrysis_carterae.AAC.5